MGVGGQQERGVLDVGIRRCACGMDTHYRARWRKHIVSGQAIRMGRRLDEGSGQGWAKGLKT